MALAAGHKGLRVEWVNQEPGDRSAVRELTGEELVPVAEIAGEVVVDSMRIVERLERLAPEPALYPADAAGRARVRVFVEWFNDVWKGPPNAIEAEELRPTPDTGRIAELSARMGDWLWVFEGLWPRGRTLWATPSPRPTCAAFPFVKYSAGRDPGDDERFHRILEEHQPLGDGFPALRAWIARVDAHPRA